MQKLCLLLCVLLLGPASCGERTVPGGRVIIRNDILDKEFNAFTVDDVMTDAGRCEFRKTFRPGDSASIPYQHVRAMRFSRRYRDHTKLYVVTCPDDFDKEITVKLIDVHTNRLGGGCALSKRGETRGGVTTWEK